MRRTTSKIDWACTAAALFLCTGLARADSVNSPNITLNVDTNRTTGPGAGNTPVTVNTITIAETALPEYTSGAGKVITIRPRPGFVFDPTSNVTAQSATIGFNGAAVNTPAILVPAGDDQLTFALTSGTDPLVQDVILINGIKMLIGSAEGAAGPAQTTLSITTSAAGGAFTDQGIVAASITTGAPDHLVFATQPADVQAGAPLLPAVSIADFGGNVVTTGDRTIFVALQANPGAATLGGITGLQTSSGLAAWEDVDDLHIDVAASGYTLRASHDGAPLLTSDTADSLPFAITAGAPGRLTISLQPEDTTAGDAIRIAVTALDDLGNIVTGTSIPVTLALGTNPTTTQLLGVSLTKNTVDGVATWDVADQLRITTAASGFRLTASSIRGSVTSDPFAITPGEPSSLRYLQEPLDVTEGAVVEPPVRVEASDRFSNRTTSFDGTVELSLDEAPCGGELTGGTATADQGVATFPELVIDTSCTGDVLRAASPGLGSVASERFDVAVAADARPIAAALVQVKPGKVVKVVARGTFVLPDPVTANPAIDGGSLSVVGATGTVTQALPASGWTALGRRRDGSKGFRFSGAGCPMVVVKPNLIKAICRPGTGTLAVPEVGPVTVVLRVGAGTARYCAACGGTANGDATKVFKRTACAAPASCQ